MITASSNKDSPISASGKLLLAFASKVTFGSWCCSTHDHNFLPHYSES
jgi:hypothetical protein